MREISRVLVILYALIQCGYTDTYIGKKHIKGQDYCTLHLTGFMLYLNSEVSKTKN